MLQIKVVELGISNKKVSGCIRLSPLEVELGLQRLPSSKYYNVPKWENRFTLGLDAAKNAQYIQKCFK